MAFLAGSHHYNDALSHAGANLGAMGATEPFFLTDAVKSACSMQVVKPDAERLKKFGVTPNSRLPEREDADRDGIPDVFAATCSHGGKRILLVRIPTCTVTDYSANLGVYRAILEQHGESADVLVLDQTHNPGGKVAYVERLFRLFISSPQPRLVQAHNADRDWLTRYQRAAQRPKLSDAQKATLRSYVQKIDEAIGNGKPLSEPVPFLSDPEIVAPISRWCPMISTCGRSRSCYSSTSYPPRAATTSRC